MAEVTLYGYDMDKYGNFVWRTRDNRKFFANSMVAGESTKGAKLERLFPGAICKVDIIENWVDYIKYFLTDGKTPCILLPNCKDFPLEVTEFQLVKVPSTDEEARAICSTMLDKAPYRNIY